VSGLNHANRSKRLDDTIMRVCRYWVSGSLVFLTLASYLFPFFSSK